MIYKDTKTKDAIPVENISNCGVFDYFAEIDDNTLKMYPRAKTGKEV